MKTFLRVVAAVAGVVVLVVAGAYIDGSMLPVNHSVSVEGTVPAPPEKVFSLITNVAAAPSWRPAVKSVKVLPPDGGRDHWIENLGHGVTMDFVATRTEPLSPAGNAVRVVDLKDPSYGGSWTYEVTPGATPGETHLHITEDGYIHPPIYRFMMTHIMGPTRNLDEYLRNITAAAKS